MGDAKARFFARLHASMNDDDDDDDNQKGDGGSSSSSIASNNNPSDTIDDIDMGVSESGRTMINSCHNGRGRGRDDDDVINEDDDDVNDVTPQYTGTTLGMMDFSLTASGKIGGLGSGTTGTTTSGFDGKSDRSMQTIGTIGVGNNIPVDGTTITERSLMSLFNTERSTQTAATMGTIDTIGTADGTVSSNALDATTTTGTVRGGGIQNRPSSIPHRRGGNLIRYLGDDVDDDDDDEEEEDEDDDDDDNDNNDDDEGGKISAPTNVIKFQPLQPLPENTPPLITQIHQRTAPRPIPVNILQTTGGGDHHNTTQHQQQQHQNLLSGQSTQPPSRASSVGSTESGFLNKIMMNPVENPTHFPSTTRTTATTTTTPTTPATTTRMGVPQMVGIASSSDSSALMSHTPPTHFATSYETSHFGKRARAGSVSERLLVSSELEEKGIINRDQKGILKDLIISGQDNELQHALDRYEQGDSTMLEGMLHSGTLASTDEIDLLGNLDFDFLNVKEQGILGTTTGNNNINNNSINLIGGGKGIMGHSTVGSGSIDRQQQQQQYQISSYQTSDGIGELDFDGGIGNWEQQQQQQPPQHQQQHNYAQSGHGQNTDDGRLRSNSTWSQMEYLMQLHQRPRSNSTMSIDLDNFRPRSNSLFSSLIGTHLQESPVELGRWMEPSNGDGSQQQQQQQQRQQHQLSPPFHLHHDQQPPLAPMTEEEQEGEDSSDEDDYRRTSEPQQRAKKSKKAARRASAPGRTTTTGRAQKSPSAGAIAREQLKEQKRLERMLKKEQKEREKQDKKEKREQAKLEKQKNKEKTEHVEKEKEREEHIPGSGRPRSMSDPNIKTEVGEDGLLHVERPEGWIGAYSPESRKVRIGRFLEKRNHRVWTKTVKYDVRKNFADSRLRVKGRFVKKEDELLMRELMSLT